MPHAVLHPHSLYRAEHSALPLHAHHLSHAIKLLGEGKLTQHAIGEADSQRLVPRKTDEEHEQQGADELGIPELQQFPSQ